MTLPASEPKQWLLNVLPTMAIGGQKSHFHWQHDIKHYLPGIVREYFVEAD
jgi:hypothetical protein